MIPRAFMRVFFYLLYRPFAFAYDWVAAFVSFGRWKDWGAEALSYVEGSRVLELGHGPGHLQLALRARGFQTYGLDESPQMSRLAARKLAPPRRLIRGRAQALPFAAASFDTVVSAFPTEYIFDPRALQSVKRTLRENGRLVVLPAAFPTNGFLRWLYQITGESPRALSGGLLEKLKAPFVKAGFAVEVQWVETKNAALLFVLARAEGT